MTIHATQPGEHSVARPLPEPPRTRQVSRLSRIERSPDALTRALEEWLAEIKLRYTIGGE
jgi:hypothetical protein